MADAVDVDILIVGAGLSGICAAHHLQTRLPSKTYAIYEGRDRLGGTWDLFRYPGIRSDSDMFTLGFPFRPWTQPDAIAGGETILGYLRDTAEATGIDRKIRYRTRVERARWSTADARWTVEARDTDTGELVHTRCKFLYVCTGYFDYDAGYTPELPGRERFTGRVVHPQHWTPDIDYTDQRVVIIGSGATAMTLVPELAKRAAHVTMLQRSPTYVISLPRRDAIREWLRARVSPRTTYDLVRWKNILFGIAVYQYCRRFPEHAKSLFVGAVAKALGTETTAAHFTPSYGPWDQRLCLIPDGDLYDALRSGRADVVTDHIATFTETGIALRSGRHLDADLIVTATGLQLSCFGKIAVDVDGRRIDPAQTVVYRGTMCSGIPNLAFAIGYTNASWTLRCDLTAQYVCRLLRHMDDRGHAWCMPRHDPSVDQLPLFDFSSGYVQRSIGTFPRQGPAKPWKLLQNYLSDFAMLRHARIADGTMTFGSPHAQRRRPLLQRLAASLTR